MLQYCYKGPYSMQGTQNAFWSCTKSIESHAHLVLKFKTILSPGIGKFCFSRFDTSAPSVDMTKGRVCGACLGSLASAMVFLQLQGQEGQTGFQ